jgi:hypothetical protein
MKSFLCGWSFLALCGAESIVGGGKSLMIWERCLAINGFALGKGGDFHRKCLCRE